MRKSMVNTPATIIQAFQSHVGRRGESLTLSFLKSDNERQTLTYGQLDQRARSIGQTLLLHAKPGDRALLTYPSGLAFIEALLGCLYAGIVAVPAYPPKKNRNAERVRAIARDCKPRLLLCSRETKTSVWEELGTAVEGAVLLATDDIDSASKGSLPPVLPEQLAFLQYTSGSTAAPKGVMVTHVNLVANSAAFQNAATHENSSVILSWLPMFHDMGLVGGIIQPLFVGCAGILMDPLRFLANPGVWLRAITEFRVTSSGGPNFGYEHCIRKISDQQLATLDLTTWKTAFNGAEPVRFSTLERFTQRFAGCGFRGDSFFPVYGLAESTLYVAGGPPQRPWSVASLSSAASARSRAESLGIDGQFVGNGRIADTSAVRIVDSESLVCVADGVEGEIWVNGPSVARGYLNRPEETEATFRAKLPGDDRHWLRTGDYGFLRDGELYITGRLKDLIIIRGRNLYPQDIERLVEQHLNFVEPNACAAFSIEQNGEEHVVVVAEGGFQLVRWSRNADAASGELDSLLQQVETLRSTIMNEFEVALHDLVFVRPTTFPRTSSGKVQRRLCRQMYLDRGLDVLLPGRFSLRPAESLVHHDAESSRLPTDRSDLAVAICRVLERWATDEENSLPALTPTTAFSSLGIDSLAAADIGLRLERDIGVKVEPDTLYQRRTIGELAAFLAPRARQGETASQAPLSHQDYLDHYVSQSHRFRDIREAGYDFFGTPIDSQDGRHVIVSGRRMLMLASYSYLGLINHPEVNAAATHAISQNGTGAHGVRLLAGTLEEHRRLELDLATFMRAEDAIVYSSGFLTNLATVSALVGAEDVVLGDERNHASIFDGCEFSAATFELFRHNDLEHLEALLLRFQGRRMLVVIDAVYSMDGDIAPVPEIVNLCRQYGALLMVDEAHSLGVIGATGRGVQEHFQLADDAIDIKMGTLSKAIASCGGFVAAKREIIDYLKHSARGFIFSAALPAAQVGAARKCLQILQQEPERTYRLQSLAQRFVTGLRELGFRVPPTESAIVPILFSSEQETLDAVKFCRDRGLFVVPVFYPAVPMDAPRIRATVMSSFDDSDLAEVLGVFAELAASRPASSQTAMTGGG